MIVTQLSHNLTIESNVEDLTHFLKVHVVRVHIDDAKVTKKVSFKTGESIEAFALHIIEKVTRRAKLVRD
jgi:hypothetical protein